MFNSVPGEIQTITYPFMFIDYLDKKFQLTFSVNIPHKRRRYFFHRVQVELDHWITYRVSTYFRLAQVRLSKAVCYEEREERGEEGEMKKRTRQSNHVFMLFLMKINYYNFYNILNYIRAIILICSDNMNYCRVVNIGRFQSAQYGPVLLLKMSKFWQISSVSLSLYCELEKSTNFNNLTISYII